MQNTLHKRILILFSFSFVFTFLAGKGTAFASIYEFDNNAEGLLIAETIAKGESLRVDPAKLLGKFFFGSNPSGRAEPESYYGAIVGTYLEFDEKGHRIVGLDILGFPGAEDSERIVRHTAIPISELREASFISMNLDQITDVEIGRKWLERVRFESSFMQGQMGTMIKGHAQDNRVRDFRQLYIQARNADSMAIAILNGVLNPKLPEWLTKRGFVGDPNPLNPDLAVASIAIHLGMQSYYGEIDIIDHLFTESVKASERIVNALQMLSKEVPLDLVRPEFFSKWSEFQRVAADPVSLFNMAKPWNHLHRKVDDPSSPLRIDSPGMQEAFHATILLVTRLNDPAEKSKIVAGLAEALISPEAATRLHTNGNPWSFLKAFKIDRAVAGEMADFGGGTGPRRVVRGEPHRPRMVSGSGDRSSADKRNTPGGRDKNKLRKKKTGAR